MFIAWELLEFCAPEECYVPCCQMLLSPIELGINFGSAQHMALLRSAGWSVQRAINVALLQSEASTDFCKHL